MIKLICFYIICFSNKLLIAQISIEQTKLVQSDSRDFFSLHIQPFLANKFQFQHDGANLIQSKYLLTGEIGVGYKRKLNSNWHLYSSINFGLLPYNFTFNIEAPKNSIFQTGPFKEDYKRLDYNQSEYSYIRLYSTIDLLFSRQIYSDSKRKNQLFFGGGLKTFVFFVDEFKYEYSSSWDIDELNPKVDLFYANIHDSTLNRVKLSFQTELSYLKTFKNGRQISTAFLFNYSPFRNIEGYYNFSNLGFSSSGTFRQSLTYFGIRCNYFIPHTGKINIK